MKIFYNIHIPHTHTHLRKYRPKAARNEIEREKIVRKNMCDVERTRANARSYTMQTVSVALEGWQKMEKF